MQKLIIDLFPIVLFFAAYKISDNIFVATAVAIVSAVLQIALMKWKKIPVQPMHWVGLVLIVVLGSISIAFRDPRFLMWKFSVLEWAMGAAIIIGQYAFGKNMLKLLMGQDLALTDAVWKKLALLWAGFFISLGTINLYVFSNYSESQWVDFKTYGVLILTVLFVIVQGLWLSKHLPKDNANG